MKRRPKVGLLLICSNRFRKLGEDTEATYEKRQEKTAQEIARRVSVFADVVEPGQIYEREDIIGAMDKFYMNKVDCVFASYLSWSDDFHWIRFLRDMYPIPVLFGAIIPEITYENTERESDFVQFLANGGLVGSLEGSGSAVRLKRPMLKNSAGTLFKVINDLEQFARAACLRSEMMHSNFGLLAQYNEVMWSTYVDPYLFFKASGAELRFLSVAALEDYFNRVSDKRVEDYITYLRANYPVRDDVEIGHFQASIRTSLAVEDIAVDYNLCAVAVNDIDRVLYERLGLRPGFCPSPGGPHATITPEGDLGACLATHILRNLSGAHAVMLEFSYIDKRDNTFVMVHGGPNDYTDPNGKTVVARDVRFAKTPYKHAGAPFAWHCISPGPKTIVHMSQCGDNFKMVVMAAESLPEELTLCSYTQGRVRISGDPAKTAESLMNIGVNQHYAVADGDSRQALRDYAEIMGYIYYEI